MATDPQETRTARAGQRYVSEVTYRRWRLYMAGCALPFEHGAIGVYQILAANRRDGLVGLPLTRHDIC